VDAAYSARHAPLPAQPEMPGVVNGVAADTDIVLTRRRLDAR
jgi:hypothetical protein